jgi:alpha-amylase/alpha-mannosidase (GH57 family)
VPAHAALPERVAYPGGYDRVKWHLEKAAKTLKHFFGEKPKSFSCWPLEGSISNQTLSLLNDFGFDWTASGGSVIDNSLKLPEIKDASNIHHPFKLKNTNIACFFRDDGLSDLIGFEYTKWHADDAVSGFIQHLDNIGVHEHGDKVVSIIMDGENDWEYFPDNCYHFMSSLYKRLANHPTIELCTFSECLKNKSVIKSLPTLVAGSWVYGTFSTWIGSGDKNRGWDMLGDLKYAFDIAILNKRLTDKQI